MHLYRILIFVSIMVDLFLYFWCFARCLIFGFVVAKNI